MSSTNHIASFKHLLKVFFPITLSLLSGALLIFCDRAFLAHYSLKSVEACSIAASICLFVQVPFMRIGSMINPIVGNLIGKGEQTLAGSYVWQMIWFSLLSMGVSLPLATLSIRLVLKGTALEKLALQYLYLIIPFSFIFTLGVVLSSFFIAIGKRWLVLVLTVGSHCLNVLLNGCLIFGWRDFIPSLGIRGAALGTLIAQLTFCGALFYFFRLGDLSKGYGTNAFSFNFKRFIPIIKQWSLFGVSRFFGLLYWLLIVQMMTSQGETGTLVITIGATLFATFIFINDGLFQSMTTIVSQLIGANDWKNIWKLTRSGALLLFINGAVLSVPMIFFRKEILSFFITDPISREAQIAMSQAAIWIWCFFMTDGLGRIYSAITVGKGDAVFHVCCVVFICIFTTILPIYWMTHMFHTSADKAWLALAIESLILAAIFYLRVRIHQKKDTLKLHPAK